MAWLRGKDRYYWKHTEIGTCMTIIPLSGKSLSSVMTIRHTFALLFRIIGSWYKSTGFAMGRKSVSLVNAAVCQFCS